MKKYFEEEIESVYFLILIKLDNLFNKLFSLLISNATNEYQQDGRIYT
jgi:hypothetical protein